MVFELHVLFVFGVMVGVFGNDYNMYIDVLFVWNHRVDVLVEKLRDLRV